LIALVVMGIIIFFFAALAHANTSTMERRRMGNATHRIDELPERT